MINNKKQVEEIINAKEVYFTSDNSKEAEKEAFESLTATTTLSNPVLKDLGVYDGESFELNDLEVVDGDSIYTLEEA